MKMSSSNESSHQIFKVDLGQDLTMSCLFDQEKLEQVKRSISFRIFIDQSECLD